jgi:hypothetical protein
MNSWLNKYWIFALIVLLAGFFRFYQIAEIPGGLFPDEAAYGIDGRSILNGEIQPFYERGNGREGLFMYFLALGIAVFGYAPWVNHFIAASFGLAAVIAAYFLAKQMFGHKVALWSTLFFAVSSYAVAMTRTGFRANTVPLFTTLTLLFVVRTFDQKELRGKVFYAALSGLFFGLGFYTYISYRMMLPLLGGFAFLVLFSERSRLKELYMEYKKPVIASLVAFFASFAWLGHYFFIKHPGSFIGRAGQVSIFSEELNQGDVLGTFLLVLKQTALGFFTEGDLNWRHNVSSFPFLSPFISIFFAAGLIAFGWSAIRLLKQAWQRNIQRDTVLQALVFGWFVLMLFPEITTAEGIPHGLRLIGVIPAVFIISGYAFSWLFERLNIGLILPKARYVLALLFVFSLSFYNYFLYFTVAASSPEFYYAYRSDLTEVSRYINERDNREGTYLSLDAFSVQTVDYLTTPTNQPYRLLVPEHSYRTSLAPGQEIVFTQSTIPDALTYAQMHKNTTAKIILTNQFNEIIMLVLERK